MASGDARPMPQKNVAYRVTFPLFSNTGTLVTGAAGLDSEVSKDAGTFADCTNEATEIATSSGMYYLDLTSTEMNADTVTIIVKTSTTDARTTPIILYPEEAGDVRVNVTQISGDGTAADNAEAFFDGTGYAGTNNVIPLVTTTTTATNLTNAPTAGDFTATMKTSISTAATSSLNSYDPPTRAELTSDVSTLATASALSTVAGNVSDVLTDTGTTIPAQISALNNISAAQVNAEVDTALADIHLDHLLANTYDPASKPGASDALLNEIVESDSGVARFTANALEQAPTGAGGGLDAAATRAALGLASANLDTQLGAIDTVVDSILADTDDIGVAGAGLTALASAANLSTVSGKVDTVDTVVDAIKATVDTNLNATVSSRATQTSVDDVPTNAELGTAISTGLATYDGPTNAEMVARTLPTADYATSANLATVDTVVDTIAAGLIVVDGLVDTLIAQLTTSRAEPSAGAPAASATLGVKVDWLYAIVRNVQTVTASEQRHFADDGTTPLAKRTLSDASGTLTRGEMVAP